MAADVVMIPNTGLAITTAAVKAATAEPLWVAMGTGTTPPAAANTTLETESAEDRTEGTSTQQTTTTANDTYQVAGTIVATDARAITEAGLLDDGSAGNLYLRGTFDVINLSTGNSIAFTIKAVYARPA